jgi:hypothetical protein
MRSCNNLDKNILSEDALFINWPDAHAIAGNPPYQSKNAPGETWPGLPEPSSHQTS